MTRLLYLLLLVCSTAFSGTLTCPAGSAITISCDASTVSTPPPAPTPTPTPTPPPSACSDSPTRTWTPFNTVQLWPVPPITGSGIAGISVAFVANAVQYPRGVTLGGVDETQPSTPKDYVVSECPRTFAPVSNDPLCAKYGAGSTMGPISLRFGPKEPREFFGQKLPSLDCSLKPGGTYVVNVRATNGGPVSSQFVIMNRTD